MVNTRPSAGQNGGVSAGCYPPGLIRPFLGTLRPEHARPAVAGPALRRIWIQPTANRTSKLPHFVRMRGCDIPIQAMQAFLSWNKD